MTNIVDTYENVLQLIELIENDDRYKDFRGDFLGECWQFVNSHRARFKVSKKTINKVSRLTMDFFSLETSAYWLSEEIMQGDYKGNSMAGLIRVDKLRNKAEKVLLELKEYLDSKKITDEYLFTLHLSEGAESAFIDACTTFEELFYA